MRTGPLDRASWKRESVVKETVSDNRNGWTCFLGSWIRWVETTTAPSLMKARTEDAPRTRCQTDRAAKKKLNLWPFIMSRPSLLRHLSMLPFYAAMLPFYATLSMLPFYAAFLCCLSVLPFYAAFHRPLWQGPAITPRPRRCSRHVSAAFRCCLSLLPFCAAFHRPPAAGPCSYPATLRPHRLHTSSRL